MKKWYKSRTLWFNVVTIVLEIVQVISNTYVISTEAVAIINGIGNIILRCLTNTGICKGIKGDEL